MDLQHCDTQLPADIEDEELTHTNEPRLVEPTQQHTNMTSILIRMRLARLSKRIVRLLG